MVWFKIVEIILKVLTFGLSTYKSCKEQEEKENKETKNQKEEDGTENHE